MNIMSAESIAIAFGVGLLSGTHTAIWGMYKDAVHEGFAPARFARSVIVGALSAMAVQYVLWLPLPDPRALLVLFGLAYATERGLVETWKTFVRDEDQSKYFIPMQFSVRGVPVRGRGIRLAAGAAYVAVVAASLYAISRLDHAALTLERTLIAALVGLAVGAIIALGGAWKDAPTEGFDPIKFMRSPAMTVGFSLVLAALTDSYLLIAAAAIGYERATVETYKKFFFPGKAPGKFAGKPVLYPHMFARRRYFLPAYVAIWLAVVLSGVVAFTRPAGPVATDPAAVAEGRS